CSRRSAGVAPAGRHGGLIVARLAGRRARLPGKARARVGRPLMPFVIASACIDVKDLGCLDVCPVDCIYHGGRAVYIHPTECIDCGLCESVCPVAAIYADDRLPKSEHNFIQVNAEFFGPNVTVWGSPGGADAKHRTDRDHPVVTDWPRT